MVLDLSICLRKKLTQIYIFPFFAHICIEFPNKGWGEFLKKYKNHFTKSLSGCIIEVTRITKTKGLYSI